MKAIVILTILISITANACPNLRGRYTCIENGRPSHLTVTQTDVYGPMEYLFLQNKEGSKIIADGVKHVVREPDGKGLIRTTTFSNFCASDFLRYHFHAIETNQKGEIVYEDTLRRSTWLDQDNNLAIRIESVNKAGQESEMTSVCVRRK